MVLQGYAELPLHNGRVPPYLLQYMKRLGKAIAMYIVDVFGPDTLIKRLADPLWFQAFNNVIGMDWDSSGSTTVVLYVLKSFANVDTFSDTGFAVLGGKGIDSREVKNEVEKLTHFGLDSEYLKYVSRFSAKIDGTGLQDGYSLYIHGLIVSESGLWTVIQQGMNTSLRMARRYHIHTERLTIEKNPHSGIACNNISQVLNLVDVDSSKTRRTILDIITNPPQKILRDIAYVNRLLKRERSLEQWTKGGSVKEQSFINKVGISSTIPANLNPIYYRPITDMMRIEHTLNGLVNSIISTFDDLIVARNVGPELIRALALVADIVYGDTPSFRDPVTHTIDPFAYAFAHGGKDGVPFPIKLEVMNETIEFLEDAINNAHIENKIKRKALERLYYYWRLAQRSLNR